MIHMRVACFACKMYIMSVAWLCGWTSLGDVEMYQKFTEWKYLSE